MDKTYAFLKPYTDRLIETGKCFPNIGLWDGKMGIAIFLFHISKIVENDKYENEATTLLDVVYEQIYNGMSLNFDDGLMGIGCGIEYLISKGFVDGDSDEILQEIDIEVGNAIYRRSIDLLNLEKGICGIGCYLYYRLKNRTDNDDSIVVLQLKEYLVDIVDWMEGLILKTADKKDYNDAYFLLTRLFKLNVCNYRIERLVAMCLRKLIDFHCPVSDSYELLGVDSLKALKPWI